MILNKKFSSKCLFTSLLLLILFSTFSFAQYFNLHRTMRGHTGWVWSVAYSPKENVIASGSADNTIKLWDISMGICFLTLRGHALDVYAVTFSKDGKFLASGSEDSTIKIWDLKTGTCLHTLKRHKAWIHGVAFSPDCKLIASVSGDKTCRLWDVDSGLSVAKLVGHKGAVWSVTFSPDGKTVATGSSDNTVRIWNVKDKKLIKTLQGHTGAIRCVAFNPSGALLASGSRDNTINVWRVKTGENVMTLKGHTGWIESLVFTPNGVKLVSASDDKTTRIWSIATGKCTQVLANHDREILSVAINPKGSRLITGSCDRQINVWRRLRLYKYTNYYKFKISDKIYEVIDVEYPGEPRVKVVLDEEGRPVKDKDILVQVLNAGDVIGFLKEPEYRKERFKFFIGSQVEPRRGALNMFIDEIPNNELLRWWRSERYAAEILLATKSTFLIGSEMAKVTKYQVPYEYAEIAIEKFLKDPIMFFTALCLDVIVDGLHRLMWVEAKCDAIREDAVINVKDYNQITDAYWDAAIYASSMDYIYNKMQKEYIGDFLNSVRDNKGELMALLKTTSTAGKAIPAAKIGTTIGEIIADSKLYKEYHNEVKNRWKLQQKEVSEIWKKERVKRARNLADKVSKEL